MNAKECEIFRQRRVRQAELIKASVEIHKVCCLCSSVCKRTAGICPICHAYRWDESPAAVIAAVDLASTSVFPFTLGYAPSVERVPAAFYSPF